MTMPHLMNCPHSETGRCLDCVGRLYYECEVYREELEAAIDDTTWSVASAKREWRNIEKKVADRIKQAGLAD